MPEVVISSLWGEEFDIKGEDAEKIIEKIKNPKKKKVVDAEKAAKSKSLPLSERVSIIEAKVRETLGHYESSTKCIRTKEELHNYIDESIKSGIIAIDTETNYTTNTLDCILRGACIYTPGMYNAYIPVNHIDPESNKRLEDQVTEQDIKEEFSRLKDTFILMHNSTFDIEVIMTTCDLRLHCDWDTMSGAFVLNENEHKSLKEQYILHIDPEQSKYSIDSLFEKMDCGLFNPDLFALYAATDSYMTYKLYEYQKSQFELPDNKEVYELFKTIEMPILDVVVDMEVEGIAIDKDYAKRLSVEYHKKSDAIQEKIDEELKRLEPTIARWKLTPEANVHPTSKSKSGVGKSKAEQLSDPIELSSTTQMAILLYDILKVGVIDKNTPRGTGADILEELAPRIPICQLLLDKRGVDILINTFIDKMQDIVGKDGRVHARFNTCGTQTGRFSSSDPNLQNIPSHAKDIRMIFTARSGYSIVGADYSAQEPRSTASLSNDSNMINAYKEGKDLYAVIGAACFHNSYEDNLEFHPVTHELQPEGKARRAKAKTVLLGVTYGMGSTTLAERMGLSREEADEIINDFYKGFPGVEKLTKTSQDMLRKTGYVTDMFGRRRHIPDGQLPEYEVKPIYSSGTEFNPLIGAIPHNDSKVDAMIRSYEAKLEKVNNYRDRMKLIDSAKKDGLDIKSNGGFINRAMRQCLNARIQGTAASMTKLAMIMIRNDKELNDLGFRLLITVHDEVLGEAPKENSERAAKRLSEVMIEAAKTKCSNVPWKCDPYVVSRWYLDEFSAEVLKDYNKVHDVDAIKEKYSYIKPEFIEMMCKDEFDPNKYEEI